jgi:hypothetical protein
MFNFLKLKAALIVTMILLMTFVVAPAAAGDRVISINDNSPDAVWFISGEPSLVMNGFNLQSLGVSLPATIDRVSLAVQTPVANTPIDLVIYQDADGGSPSNATLAGRTQVTINQSGVFTAALPNPVVITQPAVWVGFYLPVDFRFYADTSGSSVLTYWAWTPGGTFDLNTLSSAAVLGPADGTAPVNINMGGKARISFEIVTGSGDGAVGSPAAPGTPLVTQTTGSDQANLGLLQGYVDCPEGFYDTADIAISYDYSVGPTCRSVPVWNAPLTPPGYIRQPPLYDITFYRDNGQPITDRLDIAVTHCIRPAAEHLSVAVLGTAYGTPRVWRILPTQRFGDRICAEIRRGGSLAYFTPISAFTGTQGS